MGLGAVRGRHLFLIDLLVVAAAILGAMALRYDSLRLDRNAFLYLPAALFPLLIRPPINMAFGLYRRLWAYASIAELIRVTMAVVVGSIVGLVVFYAALAPLDVPGTITSAGRFPRSFFILEGLLTLAGIGGVRFLIRALAEWSIRGPAPNRSASSRVPTLVYGAGSAAVEVLRTVAAFRDGLGMRVVGLLDDDSSKHGLVIRGSRVIGGLLDLELAVARTGARRLLIAMPRAPGEVIRNAITKSNGLGLETRTLPAFDDLVSGRLSVSAIREVRVDDLLGRDEVTIDVEELRALVADRTVLVTGAGGSIGSELARQMFDLDPACLVLFDRAEGPLYDIERELVLIANRDSGTSQRGRRHRAELRTRLGNVASRESMERALQMDRPVLVLHAAAYKHVPMMENHPADSVYTNIGGTLEALRASARADVERFVLVSTDKAVEPTSVMGASKRLAELAVTAMSDHTGRRYAAVRFGNVLGSSGSVVPLFQRQLAEGVPLTVTHPEMTRFFMTIPEAARLILEAALLARPGDLFVLDMGEPIRIVDLARDLARLAGRDPDSVPIDYIGMRPGEKLHESLFYEAEAQEPTEHPKVIRVRGGPHPNHADPDRIFDSLDRLVAVAATNDHESARNLLFATLADLTEGERVPA